MPLILEMNELRWNWLRYVSLTIICSFYFINFGGMEEVRGDFLYSRNFQFSTQFAIGVAAPLVLNLLLDTVQIPEKCFFYSRWLFVLGFAVPNILIAILVYDTIRSRLFLALLSLQAIGIGTSALSSLSTYYSKMWTKKTVFIINITLALYPLFVIQNSKVMNFDTFLGSCAILSIVISFMVCFRTCYLTIISLNRNITDDENKRNDDSTFFYLYMATLLLPYLGNTLVNVIYFSCDMRGKGIFFSMFTYIVAAVTVMNSVSHARKLRMEIVKAKASYRALIVVHFN